MDAGLEHVTRRQGVFQGIFSSEQTTVGGARAEPPAAISELKPTGELRKVGTMVETWQAEPGGRQIEAKLIVVEPKAKPRGQRDVRHRRSWRPRLSHGDDRLNCWRTETESVHPRTEVEPEGRWSPKCMSMTE